MKVSFLLMLAFACTQRSAPASATVATTTADAAAPRVILPDRSAIIVEVASDDATREQGLMYRDHMAEDRGMIFLFHENAFRGSIPSFRGTCATSLVQRISI